MRFPGSIIGAAMKVVLCGCLAFACAREKDEADQIADPRGGRCYIKKDNTTYLCLDYSDGYDAATAEANCATQYDRYRTASSLFGKDWLVGDNNSCDTSGNTGSCSRSDGVLYYYAKFGTAAAVETDCVSVQAGTWKTAAVTVL